MVSWTREDYAAHARKKAGPPQGKTLVEVFASEERKERGPQLNKTEQRFLDYLRIRFGTQCTILSQQIKLRLANKTWYTPDFVTLHEDGRIMVWEVKGWLRDDAAVKLKVAAEQYPWFRFALAFWKKGQWDIRSI